MILLPSTTGAVGPAAAGLRRLAPQLFGAAATASKMSMSTMPTMAAASAHAFHRAAAAPRATGLLATSPALRMRAAPSSLGAAVARRAYHPQGGPGGPGSNGFAAAAGQPSTLRKLLVGGAIFGGTLVAVNVVFNRETRDDGGMPVYEREYLNDTFLHTGLGIGIIALTARQMVRSGFAFRLMVANPWAVAIGGMALSFGTMIGTRAIEPENYIPKYALWAAFNATQAAFVAPLLAFVPGPLLARAGLYTVAMMGSIAIVGATAKQEKYLYLGGPLLAGCAIVLMSGLAPLVVPATAVRTLALTENLWLYGGLALFGGFTLYDVQKVLHHARLAERGAIKRDAVNESISLELDFLNIFVRLVQILMMQQNRRK